MALSEREEYGMISILVDGQLQVRLDTVIERDGEEIHRAHRREVYEPDMTIQDLPPMLRRIAQLIWDPQTIAAYAARKAARRPPGQ